ncbi:MAG: hypothetical protein II627_04840 [Lachnospiraceae bacterium]|nr:hypothetical protein [Lachnospiraceae bacterium]
MTIKTGRNVLVLPGAFFGALCGDLPDVLPDALSEALPDALSEALPDVLPDGLPEEGCRLLADLLLSVITISLSIIKKEL